MLSSTTRLLRALSLLHERRFWTGAALAEALGVTERSVRRDIEHLRELGYPVHATSGVGGGYALGAGQDLPPLPLDDDEALAVAFGLRAVAGGWVAGLEQAAVSALSKLEVVLPKRLRKRLTDLSTVSVAAPPVGPRVDGAVLARLTRACRDEELLRFAYQDRAGDRRLRQAEPHRLIHIPPRWYLLAWDRDREDWRTFRVDRVASVEALHRFRPRPLPAVDLAAWVAGRLGPQAWRYRARVTVFAPACEVARRMPAPHGQVTPLDEARCELVTGGDDLGWLAVYLGLLGLEMTVHEPPELVAHLAELSARLGRAVG